MRMSDWSSDVCSSDLVDYAARQRAMNMKYFVVEQLPLLTPESLDKYFLEIGDNAVDWISRRVLELCYTSIEIEPLARDLGRDHPPFRWEPKRRVLLQAEIDALALHIYGLDRDEAQWLIDSFAVLRKYEERDLNEYIG